MNLIMLVRFLQPTVEKPSTEEEKFLRPRLYCDSCNREDYHFFSLSGSKALFLYSVIYTLGLILIFGPYRCVCCGNRRWTRLSWSKLFRKSSTIDAK